METTLHFTGTNPECPVNPYVLSLINDVQALRNEVTELHQMLKDGKPGVVEKPLKVPRPRHVNRLVFMLQVEYPEKVWTSESMATEIGCTGAAVRQTKAWKEYQMRIQNEKQERRPRRGYKDRWGNIDAIDSINEDDS